MRNGKMNQFVSGILLTLLLTATLLLAPPTEAAVLRGSFANEKYPGKCYVSENLILSSGEQAKYTEMGCARIMCGSESWAEIHTCGVEAPPPGFQLGNVKYPNADYPKCCAREYIKDK